MIWWPVDFKGGCYKAEGRGAKGVVMNKNIGGLCFQATPLHPYFARPHVELLEYYTYLLKMFCGRVHDIDKKKIFVKNK